MNATWEQVQAIVLNNPNKKIIEKGRETANKLMLHVHGVGMDQAIKLCDYFASGDMYKIQKQYAISNVDMFARLLQQEDMVFNARGGSTNFNLNTDETTQLNNILSNVEYGMNLRKWVKTFALQAYRCDPMGIIFIEVEAAEVTDTDFNEPRCYPTYKSIFSIYDYETTGRQLEYVCFQLIVEDALEFGIIDEDLLKMQPDQQSQYFRFIDDKKDLIVQMHDKNVTLVTNISQANPLPMKFKKTPAFVVSDLITFNDPSCFYSPLYPVVELADTFLQDRSIRDLQKKFHGFAKAVEPLVTCGTCVGSKTLNGNNCPDCTPAGGQPTGYKLKTKVSDVMRFPLDILENSNFDFNKIFGYVTPNIASWNKQDTSLADIEELAEMTYWGTIRMRRAQPGAGKVQEPRTAFEVDTNSQPKEARLNTTADWAEGTETMIACLMAEYWFPDTFKTGNINYGRDYVLKTPEELMGAYQDMRTKGAPDFCLDEALEKYYLAKYQNNPIQLQKYLKMLNVEPFPHLTIVNAKLVVTNFEDFNSKLYFGEWSDTIPDSKWLQTPAATLIQQLKVYVSAKGLIAPVAIIASGSIVN
jgi:hypothetical protein